jgi:hypothetical protein
MGPAAAAWPGDGDSSGMIAAVGVASLVDKPLLHVKEKLRLKAEPYRATDAPLDQIASDDFPVHIIEQVEGL